MAILSLFLLLSSAVVATENVNLIFFKNGASEGGVTIKFERYWNVEDAIDALPPQIVPADIAEDRDEGDIKLYSGAGKLVEDFYAIQDGSSVYVVPPGQLFVWPFVAAGHQVHVSHPRDDPQSQATLVSISQHPRVFVLEGFFSQEEADGFIQGAKNRSGDDALMRSTIGEKLRSLRDPNDPSSFSTTRTSSNAWDQSSALAMRLKKRVFRLLRMPFDDNMCDGFQVVRYEEGQAYQSHHDYFPIHSREHNHNYDPKNGGANRFASLFMYLSDVEEGGQTCFTQQGVNAVPAKDLEALPESVRGMFASTDKLPAEVAKKRNELFDKSRWEHRTVAQCYSGFSAKPLKLKALLFYSQTPELDLDSNSLHMACPVLSGEKWGANLWVWNAPRHDKSGGKIQVTFVNTLGKAGEMFWEGSSALPQGEILPAHSQLQTTYHGHTFSFKVGGRTMWRHTVLESLGTTQRVDIVNNVHDEL